MAVTSLAPLLVVTSSPPPATVAVLVTLAGAFDATLTVSVIKGYEAPAASTSLRVHAPAGWLHVQPVPPIAVAVRPEGSVSLTVTVPLVGPPPLLRTLSPYVAPNCPCVNVPAWD